MVIKYNIETINAMKLFEDFTKTKVIDCIIDENIIFVVEPGSAREAIGKHGKNIKKLEYLTKRKLKIVEFNDDVLTFCQNFLRPIKEYTISKDDQVVLIKPENYETKAIILGRNRKSIKRLQEVVNRYFKINIRVG